MSDRLRRYLELERIMLVLDSEGSPTADAIREAMDPLWYSLDADERRLLDQREVGAIRGVEGIHLPLVEAIFYGRAPRPTRPLPSTPLTDWKTAA